MKKTLLAILLGLCGAIPLCAQSTTVSVTVVDQTAQAWANGTISYTFSPTPGIPGPFYWGGAVVPEQYMTPTIVALDGSGSASFSVPTNTAITPSGSGWLYNVCPNASAKCVQLIIPATGSTQNISAAVTAVLKALQVNAANLPKAYSDSEVVTVPAQGGTYYNVLGQAIRYFNGSVWANLAGSGVITAVTATAPVVATTSGSTVNISLPMAMQVVPPISGQYVVIYPTAYTAGCLFGNCAADTYGTPIANNTSAFLKTTGSAFAAGQTVTWSGFSLPSYVVPANVTAIYATATSSFSGVEEFVDFNAVLDGSGNISLLPLGPIHPSSVFFSSDPTKVATAVITGDIYGQSSEGCCNKGQLNIANVALIVYYTGTPPPANTAIQVALPLYYNPSTDILSIDPYTLFPGENLYPTTVAGLPSANLWTIGTIYSVTDGTTATDCTTGGGTNTVLCQTNGTAWSAFSAGGGGMTALTGDVTGSGSGSVATTLATVNSSPGVCGDATHVCQVTTNGKGLTTAQTTVAISGSGVSQIIAGTNVTISPTGGTGAVTINATAGSSGVQYNPTNTLYVFTGDSVLGDDTGVLAPLITVTGGTCNGTICTITNSGTNGLSAGDWIYQGMTGFPTPPAPFGTVSTTYGIFQVLSTGLSSTQFEFNYTYATATITGGAVRPANYLLAQQVMQQPFFKGHGSFKIVTDANASVANIDTDYTVLFHSISPAVTGNNPEYLIINDIFNNDLQGCATAATIEGHLQSIWAKAHTDGWIVVQGTATAAPYDSSTCTTAYTNANTVNNWLYGQGKNATNTTGLYVGEYWDTLADVGAVLSNPIDTNLIATNGGMAPGGVQPYAQILNEAMGLQASATKAKDYFYYGASAVGGNTRGEVHTPLADSYHAFVVTDAAQDAEDFTVDTLRHAVTVNNLNWQTSTGNNTGNYAVTETDYMGNLSTGRPECHVMGVGNAAYNHAYTCFNYVGNGSASNNLVIGLHGDNNYLSQWPSDPYNFVFYPDGSFMPPGGVLGPATAPSGSCTRLGAFISSQDGKITYCPASGTWTTYTGAGSVPTAYSGSGAPPPLHRYWRIQLVTTINTNVEMSEIQFRAVAGTIQAPSGGSWTCSGGSSCGTNLSDLNFTTNWQGLNGATLEYDFRSPVVVNEVAIAPWSSYPGDSASAFNVQYSDDNSTWSTRLAVTGATTWPANTYQLFEMPAPLASTSTYTWYADTSVTPMALYLQPTAGGAFFPVGGSLGGGYSAAGTPLPTCASGINGDTAVVSDAAAPLYMTAYTSGGTVTAAVICSYSGSAYAWLTH